MRTSLLLAQTLGDNLTPRFTSSYNKSEADDPLINATANTSVCTVDGKTIACPAAGSEGVINKDIDDLLTWDINDTHALDFEANFSRQGDECTGDRQLGATNANVQLLLGKETNRMLRRTLGVRHCRNYSFGDPFSFVQGENTRNSRYPEGTGGSVEWAINSSDAIATIKLDNITAKTEWNLPLHIFGKSQTPTLGLAGQQRVDPRRHSRHRRCR